MKSTINGNLREIPDCQIVVPEAGAFGGDGVIKLNNLPDITDNKNAIYNGEGIIGRSFPLYTYSHSGERNIGMQVHFFIVNPGDGARNLYYLRMLQSAVYPRNGDSSGTPYRPPPICRIKCGPLLDNDELCVILQSYSVKFPTEVAWEETTYCPFRFDVDLNWQVVYPSDSLPFQEDIIKAAREARIYQSSR